ncbi:MutS-related protein [Dinghuibacter silviterrae]|uniref:MutS-like protein n=1 Tax=Dinghuibacter silviterrae TaxID=1539049 RepID=A0A4R8DJV3_9BACT|nr:hypothetical protein [Dinghuibacter silviterrae]TDW97466.1 MutS-like protein [Dinghuibacter silviterrae]
MRFTTDQQTLDDLSLFGKRGGASVYALFNRTVTLGGAKVLEDMFRYPLSDAEAINRRVGLIRYLSGVAFPFRSDLFDAVEPYLANTDERTKLSGEERSLGERLTNAVGADMEFKAIQKGVGALLELLHGLKAFAGSNPYPGLDALLTNPALEPVFSAGSKLPYAKIAALDLLLRFRHRALVLDLLKQLYYLDVYIAVGKAALDLGFVFPTALPASAGSVRLEAVYHPLLKNAVPNSLEITPENNVLFLTGANMAGKSTFMKTLGIALFLAHMGFPVPALKMEFSVLDGIYTTINLPDNLGMGASHFYAEVLRVKKVAHELYRSRNLFVIFDELFRGTNVKDAYEATIAITEAFAGKRNSIFVISTHIVEAAEVLGRRCNNVRFVYLPTRMNGHTPVYTYTLEEGVTADRHGMVIIHNERIFDVLKTPASPGSTKKGFIADKQTLDDLNLPGRYKPHSIYSLFNKVQTVGGERLLDHLFRQPLSDPDAINRRSAVFRHFADLALRFPFDKEALTLVEDYLGGAQGNALTARVGALRKRITAAIMRDEAYHVLKTGVGAVVRVLEVLTKFLPLLPEEGPFGEEVRFLKEILADKRLAALSLTRLGSLDHLFRNVLRPELEKLLQCIYALDVNIAVGNVAREKGFSYAKALPKECRTFNATALRHPGIDKAVANPLSLDGENNMLFLTGANMAGKSTFMKSFGIAVYLGHIGFPVAAENMVFSVRDGLYSSINVPDNLSLGYSHFYAEVLRVKQVAEEVSAGKDLVVIFDELFKGTNVKDAYDATLAVTEALSAYRNCLFLISTHITEVGETLGQRLDNLRFVYLPTQMDGPIPRYTYRLEPGISADRHGMLIIENEQILNLIT